AKMPRAYSWRALSLRTASGPRANRQQSQGAQTTFRRLSALATDIQGAGLQAPFVDRPNGFDGIRILRLLVRAVTFDASKSQCESPGVARARLDVVEGDLDDELRPDIDRVSIVADSKLLQLCRLPRQHLIGHALERFSEHDRCTARGIASTQMQVTQPAAPPAMTPLRREHHDVN